MPKKSKRTSRQNQDVKRSRADLKRLRDAGFISKHINLRGKLTPARVKILKHYEPYLTGKATVVPVPKGKTRAYRGYKALHGYMQIPKEKGERINIDKKTGIPYKTRAKGKGKGVKTWLVGRDMKMPPQRKGTRRMYTIRFKNLNKFRKKTKKGKGELTDGGISFSRLSGGTMGSGGGGGSLAAFMDQYEDTYGDWMDYLEVEDFPEDYDTEGYDEQEDNEE